MKKSLIILPMMTALLLAGCAGGRGGHGGGGGRTSANPTSQGGTSQSGTSEQPPVPAKKELPIQDVVDAGPFSQNGYRRVMHAPEEGKEYLFGFYHVRNGKFYYMNGHHHVANNTDYPFYQATTTEVSKAVKLRVQYASDGSHYAIQIVGGGEYSTYDGKYLEIYEGAKSNGQKIVSIRQVDNPVSNFSYKESENYYRVHSSVIELEDARPDHSKCIFGCTIGEDTNTKEPYTTVSAQDGMNFANCYICHFFEVDDGTVPEFVPEQYHPIPLETDQEKVYNENYTNQVDFSGNPVADYNLKTATGEELQSNIHHYLIDQHKTYIRYASVANYYSWTDQLDGTYGYENFYSGYIFRNNSITREHMWCCANSGDGNNRMWYRSSSKEEWKMDDAGGAEQYWGGGSDIYQLRPTTYDVNNKRQNYKYYVYTGSETYSTVTDPGAPYVLKYNASTRTCEVADEFKGDVARALMYLYIHYNSFDYYDVYYSEDHTPTYDADLAVGESSTHTPYVCAPAKSNGEKGLKFTQIMNYSTEEECIRLLKQWNANDPASNLEKQRNMYVQIGIQGNRNPFVDIPDLIDRCFPNIN